jgi:hypothetical protein
MDRHRHIRKNLLMTPRLPALCIAVALGSVASAQEMRFFYPAPPPSVVDVSKDRPYGDLQMDLYKPRNKTEPLPALVFFNVATGAQRSNPFYKAWAEIAASRDLVAILPDLRNESSEKDLDALIAHLASNAASLGVDRDRIALYAGSGNVWRALPLVENPKQTTIKAAVMYYGSAEVTDFRRDLPILLVRAGLDRPPVNRSLTDLATLAINQNAPVTVLNYAAGHHAFEIVDDEELTRDVMDRTIEFVKRATEPAYQASLRRGLAESTAAAHVANGNFAPAVSSYADLVKARPDDARLRLAYGEALLGASQFAAACTELEKLKGKGLGPRDLGVPAARACMQKGDAEAAIAWIASIPQRRSPSSPAIASACDCSSGVRSSSTAIVRPRWPLCVQTCRGDNGRPDEGLRYACASVRLCITGRAGRSADRPPSLGALARSTPSA